MKNLPLTHHHNKQLQSLRSMNASKDAKETYTPKIPKYILKKKKKKKKRITQ